LDKDWGDVVFAVREKRPKNRDTADGGTGSEGTSIWSPAFASGVAIGLGSGVFVKLKDKLVGEGTAPRCTPGIDLALSTLPRGELPPACEGFGEADLLGDLMDGADLPTFTLSEIDLVGLRPKNDRRPPADLLSSSAGLGSTFSTNFQPGGVKSS
jgi:hypothetical protein